MFHAPGFLSGGSLIGAARALRAPVDRLQVDVHADLAQLLRRDHRLRVGEMRFDRIEDHDLLALVAGFLQELLGLFDVGLLVALRPAPTPACVSNGVPQMNTAQHGRSYSAKPIIEAR